jgi:hypothetical protein
MTWGVWKPHWSYERVNVENCRASVHNSIGISFHQCGNKGTKEHEGLLWCGTHYPPSVAKRRADRDAERQAIYRARRARSDQRQAHEELKEAALAAIRKIADGHNDPRALAQEVLRRAP